MSKDTDFDQQLLYASTHQNRDKSKTVKKFENRYGSGNIINREASYMVPKFASSEAVEYVPNPVCIKNRLVTEKDKSQSALDYLNQLVTSALAVDFVIGEE